MAQGVKEKDKLYMKNDRAIGGFNFGEKNIEWLKQPHSLKAIKWQMRATFAFFVPGKS